MFGLGPSEFAIVGIVAVLLFGKRLPEVARSLGASYQQFRKGLTDLQSSIDINSPNTFQNTSYYRDEPAIDDSDEPTGPKLQLPPTSSDASESSSETNS
ncbi:MAG: twin-arginine translocase TatA/TatE family subunit [Pirellulaceae bacterium]